MNKILKYTLFTLFFLALFAECFLILKAERFNQNIYSYKYYLAVSKYRFYVRPLLDIILLFILFPFAFSSYKNTQRDLFLYLGLLSTLLADIFILSQISNLSNYGLPLYAISYLLFAEFFNKLANRDKYTLPKLFTFLLFATIIIAAILILLPTCFETTKYILLGAHIINLIYFIITVLRIRSKLKIIKTVQYLLIATICIIFSNLIYGISAFIFNFKHPTLDVATAFFYGLFLFFLVNSVTYFEERLRKNDE